MSARLTHCRTGLLVGGVGALRGEVGKLPGIVTDRFAGHESDAGLCYEVVQCQDAESGEDLCYCVVGRLQSREKARKVTSGARQDAGGQDRRKACKL